MDSSDATGNKRPVSAVTPSPEATVAHVPGANTMLMALNTPLQDGGKSSKRRCWDFTGQKYIPMAKEGYVWMCFTNPTVSSDNVTDNADQ
eukprot:COSAG05_NODE_4345_length_1557_cov_1.939643_2_plen_89_part_01